MSTQHYSMGITAHISPTIRKTRKRAQCVNPAWLSKYGLTVFARDPLNSKIFSVSCRFCCIFGREKADPRTKRNTPLRSVKHWKRGRHGFRANNFKTHMVNAHPSECQEFYSLTPVEKEKFFESKQPFIETINAYFEIIKDRLFERVD